jgi:predicted  nucleic acid-binding Zn-ribbon protein
MSDLNDILVALDASDEAISALSRESLQIPRQLEQIEARIEEARARVQAERQALEDAEKMSRSKERELQECEAQRQKYQQQTVLVKTNQEYTALLAEIDSVTARIGAIEDDILAAMEEVESRTERLREIAEEQKRVEHDLDQQRDDRRERLAVVERELAALRDEHQGILDRLEPRARSFYQRAAASHGGGTTRIRGRSCASCHRDIPYETINRVQAGELHTCGNCQRILVPSTGSSE